MSCSTSATTSTGLAPAWASAAPAAVRASGLHTAVSTIGTDPALARSAAGVRESITAPIGAFTIGLKSPESTSAPTSTSAGTGSGSSQSGAICARIATPASSSLSAVPTMRNATALPARQPAPNPPYSQPRSSGRPPYWVRTSTGNDANRTFQDTSMPTIASVHGRSSRSAATKRVPASRLRGLVVLRRRRGTAAHERCDDDEREEVGGGVHEEQGRGADRADQHAGDRGSEDERQPRSSLEQGGRLAEQRLVADELGEERPLRAEVWRDERAVGEDERQQEREGQKPEQVQHRDRPHQRRARRVREQHRPPRPEPVGDRPAPEAEQPDRRRLDGEHDAHPRGRAGRGEHEPRQRDPRHLRARRRDDPRRRGALATSGRGRGRACSRRGARRTARRSPGDTEAELDEA
jgi:hypothetical protein